MTTVGDVSGEAPIEARRAARLAEWNRRANPIVIAAAILPIVVALTERGQSEPAVWLDLASWLVFIIDFTARLWLKPGYLRSRIGVFDLVIVVLTAPWYLLPGLNGARVLGAARLGRIVRMFMVSSAGSVLRDLARRLGNAALYSGVLMMCAALVVHAVEPPESGYEHLGDALWWSVVTFTTVGYGDLFPVTTAGRIVAVMLMLGGIALIGALSGALGSFFTRLDDGVESVPEPDEVIPGADVLLVELRAMRAELADLRRSIDAPSEGSAPVDG